MKYFKKITITSNLKIAIRGNQKAELALIVLILKTFWVKKNKSKQEL